MADQPKSANRPSPASLNVASNNARRTNPSPLQLSTIPTPTTDKFGLQASPQELGSPYSRVAQFSPRSPHYSPLSSRRPAGVQTYRLPSSHDAAQKLRLPVTRRTARGRKSCHIVCPLLVNVMRVGSLSCARPVLEGPEALRASNTNDESFSVFSPFCG